MISTPTPWTPKFKNPIDNKIPLYTEKEIEQICSQYIEQFCYELNQIKEEKEFKKKPKIFEITIQCKVCQYKNCKFRIVFKQVLDPHRKEYYFLNSTTNTDQNTIYYELQQKKLKIEHNHNHQYQENRVKCKVNKSNQLKNEYEISSENPKYIHYLLKHEIQNIIDFYKNEQKYPVSKVSNKDIMKQLQQCDLFKSKKLQGDERKKCNKLISYRIKLWKQGKDQKKEFKQSKPKMKKIRSQNDFSYQNSNSESQENTDRISGQQKKSQLLPTDSDLAQRFDWLKIQSQKNKSYQQAQTDLESNNISNFITIPSQYTDYNVNSNKTNENINQNFLSTHYQQFNENQEHINNNNFEIQVLRPFQCQQEYKQICEQDSSQTFDSHCQDYSPAKQSEIIYEFQF